MAYKVAFASSDGKVVNQHFGRSKQFLIIEIDNINKEYKILERRINPPSRGDEQNGKDIDKSIELISDCKVVFVAKIGQCAMPSVVAKGIQVVEMPHPIEDIIEKIFESRFRYLKFE